MAKPDTFDSMLLPSCVFCGYVGANYWDCGSHSTACPWFRLSGMGDRREKLKRMAVKALKSQYGCGADG